MCLEAGEALRLRNLFPSFPLLPPHQTLLVSRSVAVRKPSKRAKKYLKLLKPGEEQRSMSTLKLRLLKKLRCTLKYEKLAWADGAQLIAGVDEVGRGALFGPVVAAAVILKPDYRIRGLRDSKLLAPPVREELAVVIRARAVAWAVAESGVAEIDALNILQATLLAMRRAIEQLATRPEVVWVDGLHCPAIEYPARAIVDGDRIIAAIAAASLVSGI